MPDPRADADPRLRVRGRLEADLDPLGTAGEEALHPGELDYRSCGFTEAGLDRPIFIDKSAGAD